MNFKEFVGIDVSKSHIDIFIYSKNKHAKFGNSQAGFKMLIAWIEQHVDYAAKDALFAFEHTGLYSLPLSLFLHEGQYRFTLLPGLELKRSMGITRGKNDKDDAKRIAEYAYEKREKIKLYKMPSAIFLKLKRLLSYRERLVKERAAFKGRLKEYNIFLNQEKNNVLFESQGRMIAHLSEEIKTVEKELYRLIKEDEKLIQQFNLIKTIKGVGPQTALVMIVLTNGFTSFGQWRKFVPAGNRSYAGTAPFSNESGTFKGKTKISHLANKRSDRRSDKNLAELLCHIGETV